MGKEKKEKNWWVMGSKSMIDKMETYFREMRYKVKRKNFELLEVYAKEKTKNN